MPQSISDSKVLPLDVCGSSIYGRSPKIQSARTYNMIIADGWLVDYFGYKNKAVISEYLGRGIFGSVFENVIITVYGNKVYRVRIFNDPVDTENSTYLWHQIGEIETYYGDIFIDENITHQIAICDKKNLYIYNTVTNSFDKVFFSSDFVPGYIKYQNGSFAAPNVIGSNWALSDPTNALNWYWGSSGKMVSGEFQTKPDRPVAIVRGPGKSGIFYIIGNSVTEIWSHQPTPRQFPYIKSSSSNIDYGCVNPATVAALDNVIVWLAQNEKSGPFIVYTTGSDVQEISTDGLNYKLSQLNNPQKSSAFLMKLSGHLIYQLTFYDERDNFSIAYDFTTQKLYDVSDENMNKHITRQLDFFNNSYYFVSYNDGNLYEARADLFTYDYGVGINSSQVFEIPRIRICENIRTPKQDVFIIRNVTFTLEQGTDKYNLEANEVYQPRIALRLSKDGGYVYGQDISIPLNIYGKRTSKLNWWDLGAANDLTIQIRFYGKGSFRATNGEVEAYI